MGVNSYLPKTLKEALEIRKDHDTIILAGGSDLMVGAFRATGVTPQFDKDVVIIRNLPELNGIKKNEKGELEIGALTTSREIASNPDVPWILRQAAGKMGAVGLRNSATIGGNIANASPKGDTPGPEYLLDARVVVESLDRGEREIPVNEFVLKLKTVAIEKDEIITKIVLPYGDDDFDNFFYHKIGRRYANAISKLTLCSAIKFDGDVITDFRVATTACGVKTNRSRDVEKILIGKKRYEIPSLIDEVNAQYEALLTPRAMPEYRKYSTKCMISDFLMKVSNNTAEKFNE